MNNEQIIETIKFHCEESLKYLLKRRLENEKLSSNAINEIKEAYEFLQENLIAQFTNNTI